MEKQHKPVPDCEALKYKGTPEKPDIKIFVSHRIDLDSEIIDNPLYIPVRCGATFDERENVEMLGDDTGDNISEKRLSFNELTVQYWAWKNIDADYYGICHYRRFLSFSKEKHETATYANQNGCVIEKLISSSLIDKHGLIEERMRGDIEKYDIIVNEKVDIIKTSPYKNGYDSIKSNEYWHNVQDYDNACKILLEKYPEFESAVEEFNCSRYTRMYSCFIMKKELFHTYCNWLYSILFELEPLIDSTHYSTTQARALGTISEKLFAIFCLHIEKDPSIKFKENQLVFVEHPEKQEKLKPAFPENNVTAVFMCSNYYVPYFSVSLASIIKNNSKRYNYDIIVLHKDMISENQKTLQKMCEDYPNISLRFYSPRKETERVTFNIAASTYSEEAYYRVLVPWILSEHDKAIVLDSDLVFDKDIAELFEEKIDDTQLYLAVKDYAYHGWINIDPEQKKYAQTVLKLDDIYNYVNTGVMVANLAGIRQFTTMERLLEKVAKSKYQIQEQDALNVIYEKRIGDLDLKWNFYVECNEMVKAWIDSSPVNEYKKYTTVIPCVYHYANQPKPWDVPEVRCGDIWWRFAKESPLYEVLISRMIQNRLQQLHPAIHHLQTMAGIFDTRTPARKFVDKICPPNTLRRKIVSCLAPKHSRRREFCKQIYYIFKPQYRPTK